MMIFKLIYVIKAQMLIHLWNLLLNVKLNVIMIKIVICFNTELVRVAMIVLYSSEIVHIKISKVTQKLMMAYI